MSSRKIPGTVPVPVLVRSITCCSQEFLRRAPNLLVVTNTLMIPDLLTRNQLKVFLCSLLLLLMPSLASYQSHQHHP